MMNKAEERIERMHARAAQLKRQREKRVLNLLGAASGVLMVALVAMINTAQSFHGISNGSSAGASLLSDSAGGYILVAVGAFVAGVVITAVAKKYSEKKSDNLKTESEN